MIKKINATNPPRECCQSCTTGFTINIITGEGPSELNFQALPAATCGSPSAASGSICGADRAGWPEGPGARS